MILTFGKRITFLGYINTGLLPTLDFPVFHELPCALMVLTGLVRQRDATWICVHKLFVNLRIQVAC